MADDDGSVATTDEKGIVIEYVSIETVKNSFWHGFCAGMFVMFIAAAILIMVV